MSQYPNDLGRGTRALFLIVLFVFAGLFVVAYHNLGEGGFF